MRVNPADLALGWLTVGGSNPFDWLTAANAGGFGRLGVKIAPRPNEAPPALLRDAGMRHEFIVECRRTATGILNMGSLWLDGCILPHNYSEAMDAGAEMGAEYVVGISIDPDPVRRQLDMQTLATMAHERGMRLTVEFFAYSAISSFREAVSMVTAPEMKGLAGILFDVLHFHRSGGIYSDIAREDIESIDYFQLCDAPSKLPSELTLQEEGRSRRLFPGEGDIPLDGLLRIKPDSMPVEVEIPHQALNGLSPPDCGRMVMQKTLAFLEARVLDTST